MQLIHRHILILFIFLLYKMGLLMWIITNIRERIKELQCMSECDMLLKL